MSAPLPLRFYNPVKDLCAKVNLDYETVIGTGLSSKMRETYILSEVNKELKNITKKDIKLVQEKVEELNRKYGSNTTTETSGGEVEDKGRIRYDAKPIVESVCPDDLEMDKQASLRYGMENTIPIKYKRKEFLWCPGRGLIRGDQLGMD